MFDALIGTSCEPQLLPCFRVQFHLMPLLFARSSRPGWTGLTALSCFAIIGLTSSPWFRKKYYELFQLAHMLMYGQCIQHSKSRQYLANPIITQSYSPCLPSMALPDYVSVNSFVELSMGTG